MNTRYKVWIAMVASFGMMVPMSALAKDQDKEAKKQAAKSEMRGHRYAGQSSPRATTRISAPSVGRSQAESVRGVSAPATVQESRVSRYAPGGDQSGSRFDRDGRSQTQVYSGQQRYSRSNNYGGLWFPASAHSDWDRNRAYYWNRHNYRWYEGGWLIIDGGFTPNYANQVYHSSGGASVRDVQIGLANRGYYRGAIDGDIGPRTRAAIGDYQGDHDLMVTGRINDSLLRSLRL